MCGPPRPDVPAVRETPVRTMEEVKKDLASAQWSVRSQAVLEAGRGGYRDLSNDLLRLLQSDSHPAVRQTSALVLADFGEKKAGPIIARLLSDRSMDPDFLLDALSRLGDAQIAYAAVPFLESDSDAIRLKAVSVLETLNAVSQAGSVLAMAQRNSDPLKAKTYAMALGRLHATAAESYLIGLARTSSAGPTLAASYLALGNIKSVNAIPILAEALARDFPKGRENAVAALLEIHDVRACAAAFPYLENNSEEVRYAAASVIGGIPEPRSGPRALEILNRREVKTLGPAAYILGHLKYEASRKSLETILSDRKSPEREKLAQALGWLGTNASVPLLITVLKENDGEGRYGAAWALGILRAPEALEPLMEAAQSGDAKLRSLAVEALGGMGSPKSIGILEDVLENDPALRFYAIESIGEIPGDEARKALERHLDSGDDRLKQAIILALGKRKSRDSLVALDGLLNDSTNPDIRDAVFSALQMITGQRFTSISAWKAYYEKHP